MKKLIFAICLFRLFDLSLPYVLSRNPESFNKKVYLSIFHWPPDSIVNTESYYKTFDAHHYLYLAQKWYSKRPIQQNAFFPLYPFLIRIFATLFGSFFLSGLVLSNLFSLAGFYILYLYLRETDREEMPIYLLLLAFPASFFFSRIYTESLFFLLLVLLMYGFRRKIKWMVLISSILLPLSRPHGVIVGISVFIMTLLNREKRQLFILSLAGFWLGGVIYLLIMYFSTHDVFAAIHAQALYPRVNPLKMLVNPYRWVKENFIFPSYAMRYLGPGNFVYERIVFLIYAMALLYGRKYLLREEYILLVVLGLFSALTDHFMSFSRFLLPLFPLYVALWGMLEKKEILYSMLLLFFTLTHAFLLTLHSLSYFVG